MASEWSSELFREIEEKEKVVEGKGELILALFVFFLHFFSVDVEKRFFCC